MHEKLNEKLCAFLADEQFFSDVPGLAMAAGCADGTPWVPAKSEEVSSRAKTYAGKLKDFRFSGAAGCADISTGEKLTENHLFHMVSISKLFTSTAIMMLACDGKLSIDDKLETLLESEQLQGETLIADKRYKDITIRNLLTHTSGIGDLDDYGWDRPRWDEGALRDYVFSEEVRGKKLLWSPLENRFAYSNIAYEILGYVVEKVSGMPYEEFISQRIFALAGMDSASMLTFDRIDDLSGGREGKDEAHISFLSDFISGAHTSDKFKESVLERLRKSGFAMPHIKDTANRIVCSQLFPYNRMHAPSSTLTCRPADLVKWAQAHLHRQVFAPSVYEELWHAQADIPGTPEHLGLGWFVRRRGGFTFYGHEGTDIGYRAAFWICPELMLYVIICSNITTAPMKNLTRKATDIILDYAKQQ
ncbi:MAG: beta-lactamase family protein [Clostridia bacterium]|nr:beta-lactamase family protein [Clostridia bacterium]